MKNSQERVGGGGSSGFCRGELNEPFPDLSIPVLVDSVNHFIDLFVGDLAREMHQHIFHLISRNTTLVIFTEGSEGVLEVSLMVQLLRLLLDDQTEVVEVESASAVVNLVDQILNFHICRILSGSP